MNKFYSSKLKIKTFKVLSLSRASTRRPFMISASEANFWNKVQASFSFPPNCQRDASIIDQFNTQLAAINGRSIVIAINQAN